MVCLWLPTYVVSAAILEPYALISKPYAGPKPEILSMKIINLRVTAIL